MAKHLFSQALEQLEVDKLHDQEVETEAKGEFDSLYEGIKQEVEQKKAQADNTDTDEESLDATPETDPNADADATDDTEVESPEASETENVDSEDAATSLESFVQYHTQSFKYSVAQEEVFTKENMMGGARYVGGKVLDGLGYLKDIGFEYGPVLLKHVYKGVLFAMNKTVKAVVQGTVSITNYTKRRINSYKNIKTRIAALREAIELIEEPKDSDLGLFTNEIVINQLKIGSNYDIHSNVKIAQRFFEAYFSSFEKNVTGNVNATRNLVNAVLHEQVIVPSNIVTEKFSMNGLVKHTLSGYKSKSNEIEAYSYSYMLPGDVTFIAWLPKLNLRSREAVASAYSGSKIFLGMNIEASKVKDGIDYLSISDIKQYLDTLDSICDYGINLEKSFDRVVRLRNSIRGTLNVYMRFLLKAQNKVSIENSMSDYIALKVAYLDRTHIAGALYVNDYMARVLTSSLTYLKDAVKANS